MICLTTILFGLNQYYDVYDAGRMVLWSASSQRVSSGFNDSILERRVPSVFLIGAGKCGTGALMAFMNMHPSIVTKGGEMLYFGVDHDKGYEWFRSQMPLSSSNQITIAKCSAYLFRPFSMEQMYSFNSSMKLLLIIRDPVVRTLSWYAHKAAKAQVNNESIGTFYDMLLLNGTNELNPKNPALVTGKYTNFITLWLNKFSRDQLLVLDGDMLIEDPYIELKKIEHYLGITSYFTREMFQYDQDKGFFCPVREDGNIKCLGAKKGRKHVEISEDMKSKLFNWFRPYNIRLKAVTGRTFAWTTKY